MNASELLRSLGGALTPGLGLKPGAGAQGAGGVDFASLLRRAESGDLESGRSLRIDDAAQVELTGNQLARLSQATDAAQAAGARKLFAMVDGVGVVIDVPSRTIKSVVPMEGAQDGRALPANVLVGIDAFVMAPDRIDGLDEGDESSFNVQRLGSILGPIARIENQSLLTRLGLSSSASSE